MSGSGPRSRPVNSSDPRIAIAERRLRGARLRAVVEANTTRLPTGLHQLTLDDTFEILAILTFRCPWCKAAFAHTDERAVRLWGGRHVRKAVCEETA